MTKRIAAIAFLALIINSAYIAAFAHPSIFYMANVLLHLGLGLGLMIVAAFYARRHPVCHLRTSGHQDRDQARWHMRQLLSGACPPDQVSRQTRISGYCLHRTDLIMVTVGYIQLQSSPGMIMPGERSSAIAP